MTENNNNASSPFSNNMPSFLAALGMCAAFFMPWITVFGLGVSGNTLGQISSEGQAAWIVFVLAALSAVTHFTSPSKLLNFAAGVSPFVMLFYYAYYASKMGGGFPLSIGAWLSFVCGLVLVIEPVKTTSKQYQQLTTDKVQTVASEQPSLKPPRPMQLDGYAPPPALKMPKAILLGISGPLHGRQFRMETDVFHIGANQKNDLVIAKDDYVSRNHAYLRYDKGSLWLADQHSRNGTFLNENRLKDAPLMLNVGDRIRLGKSTFEVIRVTGR